MPAVTVCSSPNGAPIATTHSPVSSSVLSPKLAGTRLLSLVRSTAMSVPGSRPTTSAFAVRPSLNTSSMDSALSTTWFAVTM